MENNQQEEDLETWQVILAFTCLVIHSVTTVTRFVIRLLYLHAEYLMLRGMLRLLIAARDLGHNFIDGEDEHGLLSGEVAGATLSELCSHVINRITMIVETVSDLSLFDFVRQALVRIGLTSIEEVMDDIGNLDILANNRAGNEAPSHSEIVQRYMSSGERDIDAADRLMGRLSQEDVPQHRQNPRSLTAQLDNLTSESIFSSILAGTSPSTSQGHQHAESDSAVGERRFTSLMSGPVLSEMRLPTEGQRQYEEMRAASMSRYLDSEHRNREPSHSLVFGETSEDSTRPQGLFSHFQQNIPVASEGQHSENPGPPKSDESSYSSPRKSSPKQATIPPSVVDASAMSPSKRARKMTILQEEDVSSDGGLYTSTLSQFELATSPTQMDETEAQDLIFEEEMQTPQASPMSVCSEDETCNVLMEVSQNECSQSSAGEQELVDDASKKRSRDPEDTQSSEAELVTPVKKRKEEGQA